MSNKQDKDENESSSIRSVTFMQPDEIVRMRNLT